MDYAKALTFVFDDPRWKEKIAIGTGLVLVSMILSFILIGVLGFFILAGYSIRLLQNVRDGEEYPLPEWDDWGEDFIRGLKFAVVVIVWALPTFIFLIPTFIGVFMTDGNGPVAALGFSLALCGSCLMFLYGLFVALAAPGFSVAFATDERINSGLQFTKIWHWSQANIGQVVVTVIVILLITLVIIFVAPIAGFLLLCIGWIVTVPLAMLALYLYIYNLFGQLAYEFPYGGMGGPGTLAPVESTDLAASPDTAIIDTPVDETIKPEDSPTDDAVDDQSGDEDKPA